MSEVLTERELAGPGGVGTGAVVRHSTLDQADVASHGQGWSDCLDRLPASLDGETGGAA